MLGANYNPASALQQAMVEGLAVGKSLVVVQLLGAIKSQDLRADTDMMGKERLQVFWVVPRLSVIAGRWLWLPLVLRVFCPVKSRLQLLRATGSC